MSHYKILIVLFALMVVPNILYAKMYKWVDKNGKVTYSNLAPPSSAKGVTISKETSDSSIKQPAGLSKEQIQNAEKNLLTNPRVVPISVSGTIVDTQGKPLSGVKMTIKESRMMPGSVEAKRTRRYQTVNGAFDVHCEDCSDVRLRFSAKGYYPEDVSFQLNEKEKQAFIFGRKGDGFKLARHGVVVQLKKSDENVVLDHTIVNLEFRQDGISRVLIFGAGQLRFTTRQRALQEKKSGNKEWGMISLNAPRSALNEIVRTLYNYPSAFRAQKSIYVEFSGADTGFVAANVSPGSNWSDAYKKMLTAPEYGYSNKLFIHPEDRKKQYFYCRIGGLYGKGSVSSLSANSPSSNNKTLTVSIEIYLNVAGRRNLNAIEY